MIRLTEEYSTYLAHHGIKGQKWGVRRYQNEDGSLTSEGKKHYGERLGQAIGSAKEKTRKTKTKVQERISKRKEMTPEEREARRAKIRKRLAIAAGIAVTAVAASQVHKKWKEGSSLFDQNLERGIDKLRPFKQNLDKESGMAYMVPKGARLQRLSLFDESKAKGHAYVTFDREDNERYKGFFGEVLQRRAALERKASTIYVHDIVARENLISPSKRERISTFLEMYKDNPYGVGGTLGNYHKFAANEQGVLPRAVYRRQYRNLRGSKQITKGYRTFVKAIGDKKNKQLRNEYFSRLRKKGYNMIQDDQDSGRRGIRPSIILDREKSTEYAGRRELLGDEIRESVKKKRRMVPKEQRHREWEA